MHLGLHRFSSPIVTGVTEPDVQISICFPSVKERLTPLSNVTRYARLYLDDARKRDPLIRLPWKKGIQGPPCNTTPFASEVVNLQTQFRRRSILQVPVDTLGSGQVRKPRHQYPIHSDSCKQGKIQRSRRIKESLNVSMADCRGGMALWVWINCTWTDKDGPREKYKAHYLPVPFGPRTIGT